MAKIFVSYKYGDNQVHQELDQKYWAVETNPLTGKEERINEATGRGYANRIEEIIGKDNIYKGESDREDLKGKTEEQIWEILKPKVHDSTVTLVVISRGMKDISESEGEQWIPNEIRYSLWEVERGERTSATNALLGVIIPDRDGSYGYIWGSSSCEHCKNIRMFQKDNQHLFRILGQNIFNKKEDDGQKCPGLSCGTRIFTGDHSYLHLVNFDEFISNPNTHIEKALEIQGKVGEYGVEKTI